MKLLSLLIITLAIATSANAEENIKLKYIARWGGLKAGEVKLVLRETESEYHYQADLNALSLVKRFTKYWSTNIAKGKLALGKYIPQDYVSKWNFKKERRDVDVNYSTDGKVTGETVTPPDPKEKHPKVEVEIKKDAIDPITAGMLARKKVKELARSGVNSGDFTIPTFDGTRKFDLHFSYKGKQKLNIEGKTQDVLHVSFYRKAIAGFSRGELERIKDQDPNIDVYLDPHNYIPVWAIGKAALGSATFTLAESCVNMAECKP